MMEDKDSQRLDTLYETLEEYQKHFLGYPIAHDFNYEPLYRFLKFPINNIGDPFQSSTYRLGTRAFEREVIDFFAELFNAPPDNYWGYVTNGGTEGNLYGLYLAREAHPNGIVYFSEDTHYSVSKNIHLLGLRSIMIRSQQSGEIDYEDLSESIKLHRDVPAIIFANIGTTMKEARDDILKIRRILDNLAVTQRYIHSDGAFSGVYAAFIQPKPAFDFSEGADSIAVSGHKFIGSPIPCGVVLAKKHNVERISQSIGYIGARDTTITGSRNAFTPLLLWYAIRTMGKQGMKQRFDAARALAEYALQSLHEHSVPAWCHPGSLTIVIPKVSEALKTKWQLATSDISHIIITPGTRKANVDALVKDLAEALKKGEL